MAYNKLKRRENRRIKRVINTPLYDLNRMTTAELREYQSLLNKEYKKRLKEFKRGKIDDAIPDVVKSAKMGKNKAEMKKFIAELSAWMRGKHSTAKGWRKMNRERRRSLEDYLGESFNSAKEYEDMVKFLGDIQQRAGNNIPPSDVIIELYEQSKRLNINIDMVKENYDYWLDNIQEIMKTNLSPKEIRAVKKAKDIDDVAKIIGIETASKYYKKVDGKNVKGRKRK